MSTESPIRALVLAGSPAAEDVAHARLAVDPPADAVERHPAVRNPCGHLERADPVLVVEDEREGEREPYRPEDGDRRGGRRHARPPLEEGRDPDREQREEGGQVAPG